mmetsp:Transcript_12214/g.32906  ORF Transcript_12214/g.32906 Transcript_12214/m.32906 type:complete len:293 (-) Transcript_12214:142-1020(-)
MDWSVVPLVLVFGAMLAISAVLIQMRARAERESEADAGAMRSAMEDVAARPGAAATVGGRRATGGSRMRRRGAAQAALAGDVDAREAVEDGSAEQEEAAVGRIKKKKEAHKEAKRAAAAAREAAVEAQREREAARAEKEAEKALEDRRAAEEAAARTKKEEEERQRKEQEEYDQWKSLISVENTGDQDEELATESQGLLAEFVAFIREQKVVVLEELAARFGLRTEEAVNRVQSLEAMGHVTGIFDDRGKFIYVSRDDMEALAAFIRKEGRVTLRDVADEASRLILPQSSPA